MQNSNDNTCNNSDYIFYNGLKIKKAKYKNSKHLNILVVVLEIEN